jgi:hypothetical protein
MARLSLTKTKASLAALEGNFEHGREERVGKINHPEARIAQLEAKEIEKEVWEYEK